MLLTITRPAIPFPLPLSRGGLEATTPAGGRATLELGDLAQLTAPGGTSTFLRADKTWAAPPGGGGGSTTLLGLTDVPDSYTGQAGKLLAVNSGETGTEFVTPAAGGGGYTDEQAQDAVGAMLADTVTIALAYADATPALTASVIDASIGTTHLANDAVTYAKLQNVTDVRLLGRSAGSAGDAQELTVGAGLSLSAGALTSTGQPLDATLTALAGLATGADQLPYATGADTFAQTTLTTFARTLLDDTSQAAMQTTLGLVPGTNVQAQDAELQALAGLTSAADRLPYFTGLGTAALATFTAAGRTLAGAADAAAQRTALALGTHGPAGRRERGDYGGECGADAARAGGIWDGPPLQLGSPGRYRAERPCRRRHASESRARRAEYWLYWWLWHLYTRDGKRDAISRDVHE